MGASFGSDNHAAIHPKILEAITIENSGYAASYGTDELTLETNKLFEKHFGPCEVYYVFNGTAANVLALKAITRPFHSVLCSDVSHLQNDECGAPEHIAGVKLITAPSIHGKIQLEELKKLYIRKGDQHYSQAKVLSITQPTELGTSYSIQEIKELITWAKAQGFFVHMDGARLANACVFLKKTFKEVTSDLGVDVLSFGGSKNGFLLGEAVVFFNKALAQDFKFIRKQNLQLPSKTRFLAAQFKAYLESNLCYEIATHAHQMALLLEKKVLELKTANQSKSLQDLIQISHPIESNAVFAKIPKSWVKPLRDKYFFYVWDEHNFECRWMTSWQTSPDEVLGFVQEIEQLTLKSFENNSLTT